MTYRQLFTIMTILVLPTLSLASKQVVGSGDNVGMQRAKLNSNFTELYDADTSLSSSISSKASSSSFSSSEAFKAAFGWTPGGDYNDLTNKPVAGTDYLAPTGSAANLTNFPILNQNTTGNAATATALQTPQAASATPFSATSGISATTVQGAIEEVKAESTVPAGATGQIPVYNSSGAQVATTPLAPVAGSNITLTTNDSAGTVTIASTGGATYPGAGIPQSTGSAWGTSITPGTGVATALAAAVDGTGGLASKALVDTITAGSFAFDTYPTYEDSAHSGSGIAVNGTTLAVYSPTAGKWLTVGLTDSLAPAPDTTPDTFTFGDTYTDATVSTQYCSASITPTGFNSAASIVSTGTGTNKGWKIDGGAFSTTGTLSPGSSIQTCHESSSSNSTSTTSSLTIGGVAATAPFTVRTIDSVGSDSIVTINTTSDSNTGIGNLKLFGQSWTVATGGDGVLKSVIFNSVGASPSASITCRVGLSANQLDMSTNYAEGTATWGLSSGEFAIPIVNGPTINVGEVRYVVCQTDNSSTRSLSFSSSNVYSGGTKFETTARDYNLTGHADTTKDLYFKYTVSR